MKKNEKGVKKHYFYDIIEKCNALSYYIVSTYVLGCFSDVKNKAKSCKCLYSNKLAVRCEQSFFKALVLIQCCIFAFVLGDCRNTFFIKKVKLYGFRGYFENKS